MRAKSALKFWFAKHQWLVIDYIQFPNYTIYWNPF